MLNVWSNRKLLRSMWKSNAVGRSVATSDPYGMWTYEADLKYIYICQGLKSKSHLRFYLGPLWFIRFKSGCWKMLLKTYWTTCENRVRVSGILEEGCLLWSLDSPACVTLRAGFSAHQKETRRPKSPRLRAYPIPQWTPVAIHTRAIIKRISLQHSQNKTASN